MPSHDGDDTTAHNRVSATLAASIRKPDRHLTRRSLVGLRHRGALRSSVRSESGGPIFVRFAAKADDRSRRRPFLAESLVDTTEDTDLGMVGPAESVSPGLQVARMADHLGLRNRDLTLQQTGINVAPDGDGHVKGLGMHVR